MHSRSKPISEVTEEDLRNLITDEIEEGKDWDYKRDLQTDKSDDKEEFLRDVVSFANTAGGHLLYGVEEADRKPASIPGLLNSEVDKAIQRLENLIRDGIEPRITGIHIGVKAACARNCAREAFRIEHRVK